MDKSKVCGAVVLTAVLLSVALSASANDESAVPEQSIGPAESALPTLNGSWSQLSDAPFGSNFGAGAWTGDSVLVVDVPTGRAASYSIDPDRWSTLSNGPKATSRKEFGSQSPTVWTGNELLLFDNTLRSDKAFAFDATTGTWRRLPPMPIVPSYAVWADGQAVIANPKRHAAVYDPEQNAWTELPRAPGQGQLQGLFWSGAELLAITAPIDDGVVSVAALDLRTRVWDPPIEGPVSEAVANEGLWVGDRLLFASGGPSSGNIPGVTTDATFDPAAGVWAVRDYDCVGSAIAVWNGDLVISGRGSYALDPTSGQCYAFPDSVIADEFGERRAGDTRVWTGHELILWSGDQGGEGGPPTLDAVSFRPAEGGR